MVNYEVSLKTLICVFRRECHRVLDSERTTIHGADSMLMVLQLVAAEVCKQESGEFSVALSDVLVAWKCLLLDKLHLSHEGSPLAENYDLIRKEYDSFLKRTNTMDLIDVYNMYKQLRLDEDPENPLTAMQLFEFLLGNMEVLEETGLMSQFPATPSNKARSCNPQLQRAVQRILCSYMSLLVNTKNDLALAHTLDTPSRSLGHTAFTDIKHAARNSSTSLFLAATSFVRAIQLGGKGYAPPESDPLRKHIKGLSQFVHFTDQLEEILGEISDPSAAGARMVSSIRAALLKGLSNADPVYTPVEDAVNDLKERIRQIHTRQKESALGTGISPARPRAYAINHATAYAGRETIKVLITLLDEEALVQPCRNKAQLLTNDQAFMNGTEGLCLLTLYKSPEAPTGISPKPLRNRVQNQQEQPDCKEKKKVIRSQFACTYADDGLPLNRVLNFPSTSQLPTCVHPAPKCIHGPTDILHEEESEQAEKQHENQVELEHDVAGLARSDSGHKTALEQRCINSYPKTGASGKATSGTKTSKRKLSNRECVDEKQPPQKRPPSKACNPGRGKKSSNEKSKIKNLIVGQSKLTNFFRL
ncbi:PCNA-interacting partner [Trichomycterus rosablanca]|uniref:PCNA-interacting partner n=1 Tax=Trichomycterus rosablanca TaxID=2290929 RepID=UPI002F35E034